MILAVLFTIYIMRAGLFLHPISAHKHSESSLHYGPTEIVHTQDFKKGKHILGRYGDLVSFHTINRVAYFLWRAGAPSQFENDGSKALDYLSSSYEGYYNVYGAINDSRIKRVVLTLDNEATFSQTNFYEDLFLFTLELKNDEQWPSIEIKGYDENNNILFEEASRV